MVALLALIVILVQSLTVSATGYISATDYDNVLKLLQDTSAIEEDDTLNSISVKRYNYDGKEYTGTFSLFKFKQSDDKSLYLVTFNNTDFDLLDKDSKEQILALLKVAVINSTTVSSTAKHVIYSEVRNSTDYDLELIKEELLETIQPDIYNAYLIFKPFQSTLGVILGVLSVLLVLFLTFTTMVDIIYISFSGARNFADTHTLNHGSDNGRPVYVSKEAYKVMVDYDNGKLKLNPLLSYFKHRVINYLVIAICLLYLLSGEVVDLITMIYRSISSAFGFWG